MTKRVTSWLALAVATALLGACADPVPGPVSAPTAEETTPVLTPEQLSSALKTINDALQAADAKMDLELLDDRLVGPALAARTNSYNLAKVNAKEFPLANLVAPTATVSVSAGVDWPRSIIEVTETPEGGQVPLLRLSQQADARSDYKLWGWVRLLPGATVPSTAAPEVGLVETGTPKFTAKEVIDSYTAQVTGGAQDGAPVAISDPYTQAASTQVTEAMAATKDVGTVKTALTGGKDEPVSIPTADGGLIVFAPLEQTVTYQRTVAGATFQLQGAPAVLLGQDPSVYGTVTVTYDVMLAFVIPAKDAKENATVIGADRTLRSVVADKSTNPDEQETTS